MSGQLKWASLNLLEKSCEEWFLKNYSTRPLIPSVHDVKSFPEADLLDVVLVGRLHEEILNYADWPGKRFRLWAMCSAARRARIVIGGMKESDIGFLPRYELFPVVKSARNFPVANTPWTIVYSGRITKDKGFATFLQISSGLQEAGENVTPVIFGMLQQGRNEKDKSEIKEIKNLIGTLPWKNPPQIHLGVSSKEWTEYELPQPVLFNFTTFINDDFGVSAAQAQQAGWPMLLSNWGGHRDVIGSNVRKFTMINDTFPGAFDILKAMRSESPQYTGSGHLEGKILHPKDLAIYSSRLMDIGIKLYKDWPSDVQEKTRLVFNGDL